MPAIGVLLERDEELAVIERALEDVRSGAGALLTIEGEAGAGKTALLDAAADAAARVDGTRVLRARAGEFERDFAYGVVRQLFEPLAGDPAVAELLAGAGAGAVPVFDAGIAATQEGDPFAVQHGLSCLVAGLADAAPLLLLIDDAQWADLASLHALVYGARRLGGLRAGLILTVRSGEPGEHEPLLDEVRRQPGAASIEPPSLTTSAVATMLAAHPGGPTGEEAAGAARDATGGNPFLLGQLLRALEGEHLDEGSLDPDRLAELAGAGASRAILARLKGLGAGAVATARAVAVLEPNATSHRIAALGELDAGVVADNCERLVRAGLLTDSQPVAFVHPLIRAAVLSEIATPRRTNDHGRAARLLADDDAPADAVAAHLLLTEPAGDQWTVAELRAAADEALGRGAPATAATYLRRALREPPQSGVRQAVSTELGVALLRADDPEGIEVLKAVRSVIAEPNGRALIATQLSVSLAIRRPGPEGPTLIRESLRELDGSEPELAQLLRGHLMIQTLAVLEEVPPELLVDIESWPTGETPPERLMVRLLSYLYAMGYGRIAEAGALLDRAGLDPDRYREDVLEGVPAQQAFGSLTLCDRGGSVDPPAEAGIEASRERGAIVGVATTRGFRAFCRLLDGELEAAAADAEMALRLALEHNFPVTRIAWTTAAMRIALARGDSDGAQRILDEGWEGKAPIRGIPGAVFLVARGELRAATGRHAEARHDFLAAAERVEWLPLANPEMLGWRTGLAISEAALGNREEADRLATEAVRLAEDAGGDRGIGLTRRVLGTVRGGAEGIELIRDSAQILAGTRARPQHAIALVELGAALRRANQRADAREPLRQGLELAHRCGAAGLAERARTELEATGARPRREVLSGVESLTPSELRTARLAASGMTNREIAAELFVTPKTVETHLRHVYQKLEVARRGELADVLGGDEAASS